MESLLDILYRFFQLPKLLICAIVFVLPILHGFLNLLYHCFFGKNIIRHVKYGPSIRNTFDIYLPKSYEENNKNKKKYPVLIFVPGGAWMVGYKAWGALLGRVISDSDIMFISLGKFSNSMYFISGYIYFLFFQFKKKQNRLRQFPFWWSR